jgi:hypothetical protein
MEVSGHLHAPTALTPVPIRSLDGPQNRSGPYGKEKNLLPFEGIDQRFLGHPAHNLAAIPTEL